MASWTLVSVLMSFVLPGMEIPMRLTRGLSSSLTDLIGLGELLRGTIGLSVYAAGALFISGAPPTRKVEAGAPAICILLLATHYYAGITAAVSSGILIDSSVVVNTSIVLHVAAIAIGSRCTWLSEDR
jgi:hypothetical protein